MYARIFTPFNSQGYISPIFQEPDLTFACCSRYKEGTTRFPSIESWMFTEGKGWILADRLDDAQFDLLLREAKQVLRPFVTAEGKVVFNMPAHIVTAVKYSVKLVF